MLQPLPDAACWHQTPAGLLSSSICGTLQHIMQEPQARPGTSLGVSLEMRSLAGIEYRAAKNRATFICSNAAPR